MGVGLSVWGFDSEAVSGVLQQRLPGRMIRPEGAYSSGSHVKGGGSSWNLFRDAQ